MSSPTTAIPPVTPQTIHDLGSGKESSSIPEPPRGTPADHAIYGKSGSFSGFSNLPQSRKKVNVQLPELPTYFDKLKDSVKEPFAVNFAIVTSLLEKANKKGCLDTPGDVHTLLKAASFLRKCTSLFGTGAHTSSSVQFEKALDEAVQVTALSNTTDDEKLIKLGTDIKSSLKKIQEMKKSGNKGREESWTNYLVKNLDRMMDATEQIRYQYSPKSSSLDLPDYVSLLPRREQDSFRMNLGIIRSLLDAQSLDAEKNELLENAVARLEEQNSELRLKLKADPELQQKYSSNPYRFEKALAHLKKHASKESSPEEFLLEISRLLNRGKSQDLADVDRDILSFNIDYVQNAAKHLRSDLLSKKES